MKKNRFSVERIVRILKPAEVGVPVAELVRRVGISEQTFYRWKKQYVGLEIDQVRQLKQLQEENQRLKRLVADLTLDKTMLQDVLAKKILKPPRRRPVVQYLRGGYGVSERRACVVIQLHRGTYRYQSHKDSRIELRMRMREIATVRGAVRVSENSGAAAAGSLGARYESGVGARRPPGAD